MFRLWCWVTEDEHGKESLAYVVTKDGSIIPLASHEQLAAASMAPLAKEHDRLYHRKSRLIQLAEVPVVLGSGLVT